jgi:hypothetical protein
MELSLGKASYNVKYTFKKVVATSSEVKGHINEGKNCDFSLAVPIKSFVATDPTQDLHMQQATEADKYPVASAKGSFPKEILSQATARIDALIDFHGVTQVYSVQLMDKGQRASLIIDLDKHNISRPSLFGIKIKNEVVIDFELNWK